MNERRHGIYQELHEIIGKTSLVEYTGKVPNRNKIWIKRECDNPFGSHYDRVYLALFEHYEEGGRIKQGDKVLETTSGSAGVSFAGIGKLLGYDCTVAIPEGGEKARVRAIEEQGAKIIFTAQEKYIAGFPAFIKEFLLEHRDHFFLNHSMGKNGSINEVTISSLEMIAHEVILQQFMLEQRAEPDYFIPAVGNGSSVLGIGRVFQHTKIVPFETVQSAVLYDLKFPGKYEKEFGIMPGALPRHTLPGTSYQGIDFPHIQNAVSLVDDVVLVSDASLDSAYTAQTARYDTEQLPHWDRIPQFSDVGRTTHAAIAVALSIAEKVTGKNMLVIAYDKAERYDLRG